MTSLARRVLIVGSGLIGTSVALGLRARGVTVYLADADPDHLAAAVERGAGLAEPAVDPELVVVAVPPAVVVDEVRRQLAAHPRAAVTDVASVKLPVVTAIDDPRFVGSHPMAGRERSGPGAAVDSLFEGRPWAIVPGEASSVEAIATVEAVARALGAVPLNFTADSHDRAVAVVSHVPQLVSSLVAGLLLAAPERATGLAGPGLRDVTRIARSDTGLWLDIVRANGPAISETLTQLRSDLDALIADVDGDAAGIAAVLERGRAGATTIPGKHGAVPGDVASVYVPIDDVPGELSRLIADVGESGVNIEDLRIDHEIGRAVGLVEIIVVPTQAEFLRTQLNDRGWAAY